MPSKRKYVKPITEATVSALLQKSVEVLSKDPTLLELHSDIVIVGDLHGNIKDLIRIFERLHYPPATKFLFLGDYVDRGDHGVEVMLLLLAMKIKFPTSVYLIRGNHECQALTNVYGFEEEVIIKYNSKIYNEFLEVFFQMPFCAVIERRIFCVHGGISPDIETLEQIKGLPKIREIPLSGVYTDFVWSDPDMTVEGYVPSHRGCGYIFSAESLDEFLADNDLDLLVRSHEACDEGVHWPYAADDEYAERCITIFSNTDYCGRDNSAAVMIVSETLSVSIETIECEDAPDPKRAVLMPYWLSAYISQQESARKARRAARNAENIDTNSAPRKRVSSSRSPSAKLIRSPKVYN